MAFPAAAALSSISGVPQQQCKATPFPVPQFKVGTLDSLMTVADDLEKVDSALEQSLGRLVDTVKALLEVNTSSGSGGAWTDGNSDAASFASVQLKSALLVQDKPCEIYVQEFQWNAVKYRTDRSLGEIVRSLSQDLGSMESVLKKRLADYNQVKNTLIGVERRQTGSLAVKSLAGIVRREHVPSAGSEFLKTVFVAVPKTMDREFVSTYERLNDMVVPRSALLIASDDEYHLYSTVVFQKAEQDYLARLRECKFVPREFAFDEQLLAEERKTVSDMGATAKEQWTVLVRLCKSNFSEMFASWIHVKAMRVFVEAVLRYGLPPDFSAFLVEVPHKRERKVRDSLIRLCARLVSAQATVGLEKKFNSDMQLNDDASGGAGGNMLAQYDKNFLPYVNFDLSFTHLG